MKTITYNPETHVLVPREPSEEMLQAALRANMRHVIDCINDPTKSKDIGSEETCKRTYRSRYASMIAAAPQPEPNPNWCAGCSPDNCSGCGAEPAAYIFKPNNELLWPNEVDQNVFASDPEDYDLLYTTPQPDRTAELSALKAENATAWAQAHRLALELECLLLDTKDNAIVSKWWDSGMEALNEYQELQPGAAESAEAWAKMRKETL